MDSRFWAIALNAAIIFDIAVASFGYDGKLGPEFWPDEYPACGGKHQSPINIAAHFVLEVDLPLLEFTGYDDTVISKLSNNGHTVVLAVNTSYDIYMRGGPLRSEYVFNQLHFHWGSNDSLGSEDTINGEHFPMELHIVSYKRDYGDMTNAVKHEDGLAVMAFFFSVDDNYDYTQSNAYTEIVASLPQVLEPDSDVQLQNPLSLISLMSEDMRKYYTYHGSLTTPPCSEVVTWLDFEAPILLSHDQINAFRKLHSHEGLISHNYRPTQPVGERTLWYNRGSWNDHDIVGAAANEPPRIHFMPIVMGLILSILINS